MDEHDAAQPPTPDDDRCDGDDVPEDDPSGEATRSRIGGSSSVRSRAGRPVTQREIASFLDAAQRMLSVYDPAKVLKSAELAFARPSFSYENVLKSAELAFAKPSFGYYERVLKSARDVILSYDPARLLEQAAVQLSQVDVAAALNDISRVLNSRLWLSDPDVAAMSHWAALGLAATVGDDSSSMENSIAAAPATSLADDVLASVIAALAVFGVGCVLVIAVLNPSFAAAIATWLTIVQAIVWAARRGVALLPGAEASTDRART